MMNYRVRFSLSLSISPSILACMESVSARIPATLLSLPVSTVEKARKDRARVDDVICY